MSNTISLLQKVLGIFLLLGGLNSANANVIYSQNFESDLSSGETSFGAFAINNNSSLLNNGTRMMGHAKNYADDEYSYYQFTVNLVGVRNAIMQFDYAARMENHYDGFNVMANKQLLTPLSGMTYDNQGHAHNTDLGIVTFDGDGGLSKGTALFDLSEFEGQILNIKMQFGSDEEIHDLGINLDNILITSEVPEPSSIALLTLGLFLVARRKMHTCSM